MPSDICTIPGKVRLVASGLTVKVGDVVIPGLLGQGGRGFKGVVENGRGVWKGMENAV